MLVLICIIISLIISLIISKIFNNSNEKFFLIWLRTIVTIGTIAVSILSILTITEVGVTNESMLYLFAVLLCWVACIVIWEG